MKRPLIDLMCCLALDAYAGEQAPSTGNRLNSDAKGFGSSVAKATKDVGKQTAWAPIRPSTTSRQKQNATSSKTHPETAAQNTGTKSWTLRCQAGSESPARPAVVAEWRKPSTELRQLRSDFWFSLVNEVLEEYNGLPTLIRSTGQTLSRNDEVSGLPSNFRGHASLIMQYPTQPIPSFDIRYTVCPGRECLRPRRVHIRAIRVSMEARHAEADCSHRAIR